MAILFALAWTAPAFGQIPRFQGTLTQTRGSVPTSAQIWWQAPDQFKVEVARDDKMAIPAETVLASGNQTLIFEPATLRVHRLGYNVATTWWRGWGLLAGGPANFAFTGAPAGDTPGVWRRESVLFGGGGNQAYYAAHKRPVHLGPAQVVLSKGPLPNTRTDAFDAPPTGGPGLRAMTNLTWEEGGLPATAVTQFAGDTVSFTYHVSAVTAPFPASTFALPDAAKGAIIEEDTPGPPVAYAGAADASGIFNLGTSLLLGSEDFNGAFANWDVAAGAAPGATAPALAEFETAMTIRDRERAQAALDRLKALPIDAGELAVRRARLCRMNRDFAGCKAALDDAAAAAPDNPEVTLLRAQNAIEMEDLAGARRLLVGLLSQPQIPGPIGATAAQTLVQIGDAPSLAAVPAATEAQQLTHALWSLALAQPPAATDLTDPDLLAALGTAEDTAGRRDCGWR